MRIILAIVSLIIAALCLGYSALVGYLLTTQLRNFETGFSEPGVRLGIGLMAGSFILELLFVAGGVAVLTSKPRRKE